MRTPEFSDTARESASSEDRMVVRRFFAALRGKWRVPLVVTCILFFLVAVVLAILRLILPTTTIFVSQFHFTFPGAELGRFPNEMQFSINEVIDPAILDLAYDQLDVGKYGINREKFYGAFSIRPFLLTETEISDRFRQQLSDRRLSFSERERVEQQLKNQLEQASRGAAELSFIIQSEIPIPTQVGRAIVEKIPFIWSKLAIEKKGVLRIPGFSGTRNLISQSSLDQQLLPLRIVSLTVASQRLEERTTELLKTPGVMTMADPANGESIRDIERDISDFQLLQVNPLRAVLVTYHFDDGGDELQRIVERQIANGDIQITDLTKQADALSDNIVQFVQAASGLKGRSVESKGGSEGGAVGGSTTIPQVSESFIDKIIELTRADRQSEQLQAFVADRMQAQYELRRRGITAQAQQRTWTELLNDLRADSAGRKALDAATQTAIAGRIHSAAEQANAKWSALSRIESEFAANRTGRTAEIYALYATPRDVTRSDPILNSTVITAAVSGLVAFFLGFWILRAGLTLIREAREQHKVIQ
jgi:hypothetical protein